MDEENKTPATSSHAFVLKGTFSVVSKCPTCKSITHENEVSGEADWVSDDLDFLVRVLRDELDDLIYEFENKAEEGEANDDGDVE